MSAYRCRVAEAMTAAREAAGVSQRELADRLGRDKRTIQKWEKGEMKIALEDFLKGLEVSQKKGIVAIEKEGSISKFVDQVKSISFSARRAIANGQKVLYVTERCVFRLTPKGLKLIEVYPGIDVQKDILDLLPFEVEV